MLVIAVLSGLLGSATSAFGSRAEPDPTYVASAGRRPNIVFFLSDDHAAPAIGCYGGRILPTPNLDRLAREGMRFDRAFCTESICGPSRAAFMTGKYGHVSGAKGWAPYDRKHRTFPEILQAAGYQTALVGKYHLGDDPPGFDYADVLPGQGRYRDPQFVCARETRVEKGHVSDVVRRLALAWLDRRDPRRPFLICIHDKATHMPWQPAERFQALLADRALPEPPSLHDERTGRATVANLSWLRIEEFGRWKQTGWGDPPPGLGSRERRSWFYQQYMKAYLRCVAGLDENIGQVLDWLDRERLTQDTVVIYASDQGFFLGEHGWFDKRWMMEESLRLPLLVRYPRLVRAGATTDAMVLNIDLAPTLLDLAGVTVPGDLQGQSLRPVLTGSVPTDWRRAIYYRYYETEYALPPHAGVRTERYKLIHYQGFVRHDDGTPGGNPNNGRNVDEWELLDLLHDPGETRNLFERPEYRTVVEELRGELARLQRELGDGAPGR